MPPRSIRRTGPVPAMVITSIMCCSAIFLVIRISGYSFVVLTRLSLETFSFNTTTSFSAAGASGSGV